MPTLVDYWASIPVGRMNRATYNELCRAWGCNKRMVRHILHRLSQQDNGDGMVLIRSSQCGGFYRTDDKAEIERYKRETISRAVNTFAPLRKINRILGEDDKQLTIDL